MTQIPAKAWIGVGAIISAASLLLQDLILFIIPGAGFIIWGAYKAIKQPSTDSPKHTYNTKPRTRNKQNTKRCYVCSAKNHSQANYCGHCGHKLT